MSRISVIAAVAALTVAASAAPANAWGNRYHAGRAAFGLGVGFGDYGYHDYAYYRPRFYGPRFGVSFGYGPRWGYGYSDYAYAGPGFGVSFGFGPRWNFGYDYWSGVPYRSYRTVRFVPRYRFSRFAWGPSNYAYDYAYNPYDENAYYGDSSYASVGFAVGDEGWRTRSIYRGARIGRPFGRRYASTGVTGRTYRERTGQSRTIRRNGHLSASTRGTAVRGTTGSTTSPSGNQPSISGNQSSTPPAGGSGKKNP